MEWVNNETNEYKGKQNTYEYICEEKREHGWDVL